MMACEMRSPIAGESLASLVEARKSEPNCLWDEFNARVPEDVELTNQVAREILEGIESSNKVWGILLNPFTPGVAEAVSGCLAALLHKSLASNRQI